MYQIIQYYNDRDKGRQREYDFCLEQNLNNPAIKEIHNIIERDIVIPEKFKNNSKLKTIPINYLKTGSIPGRLTFEYVFDYIKDNIPPNEIVCLSNLDIFLDNSDSWINIKKEFFDISYPNKVICLSRYEHLSPNNYKLDNRQLLGSSHDSWIFSNNLTKINDCNFAVGNAPGCDGAIARRFYDSGYIIFNWMKKYKSFHYDIHRGYLNYTLTDKTDHNAKKACNRSRMECPPDQDWKNVLLKKIRPKYIIK